MRRKANRGAETDLITLRPFTREDFVRLISWVPTEPDLVEWCAAFFQYPLTDAQLERYLESARQPNSRLIFTARSVEGEGVGHIEISQIWPHLSTRLSRILVAPGKRRRGIASGMVAQALNTSFEQYSVDRVDLGVSAGNLAAIDCYLKLGFRHVGRWFLTIRVEGGNQPPPSCIRYESDANNDGPSMTAICYTVQSLFSDGK